MHGRGFDRDCSRPVSRDGSERCEDDCLVYSSVCDGSEHDSLERGNPIYGGHGYGKNGHAAACCVDVRGEGVAVTVDNSLLVCVALVCMLGLARLLYIYRPGYSGTGDMDGDNQCDGDGGTVGADDVGRQRLVGGRCRSNAKDQVLFLAGGSGTTPGGHTSNSQVAGLEPELALLPGPSQLEPRQADVSAHQGANPILIQSMSKLLQAQTDMLQRRRKR